MTCVPWESIPRRWGGALVGGRERVREGIGVPAGGRGSSAAPGVGVVERIKVQN